MDAKISFPSGRGTLIIATFGENIFRALLNACIDEGVAVGSEPFARAVLGLIEAGLCSSLVETKRTGEKYRSDLLKNYGNYMELTEDGPIIKSKEDIDE